MNYSLLEKLLIEYPNEGWCFEDLTINENISIEFIYNHKKFNWNYDIIEHNPNYTIKYKNNNSYYKYKNSNIKDLDLNSNDINWYALSCNKNIDENFVEKYKKNIDFNNICNNPNISFEYLVKNIDKINQKYYLSNSPNLKIKHYEKYKNKLLFNYYKILQNPNFDFNYIINNFGEYINNFGINLNSNIDINIFLNNKDIFDLFGLLQNENIDTIDIIYLLKLYPLKNYNKAISLNPNLNSWFIKKYKKYINFEYLSDNKFIINTQNYYKNRKEKTIIKNNIIEEELMIITWNPTRFINWCLSIDEL